MAPSLCFSAAVITVLLASPALVNAQYGMSFSVYTDVVESGAVVYLHGSAYDNSWGCYHSGYSLTSTLTSPTSRVSSISSSGLYANTSLPVGSDYGTYSGSVSGNFDCSCLGYTTSFLGDNQSVFVQKPTSLPS